MAIQLLGGTTEANDNYTGPERSITIDTDRWEIRLHDGTTPGGFNIGGLASIPLATSTDPGLLSASDKVKLDGLDSRFSAKLNISDVVDSLSDSTSSDKALSARQGAIIKGYIDSINTLLASDDTSLDELQEIVDFIKLNRSELDSLGINSIAGLQSALNAKAPLSNPTFSGIVTIDEGTL